MIMTTDTEPTNLSKQRCVIVSERSSSSTNTTTTTTHHEKDENSPKKNNNCPEQKLSFGVDRLLGQKQQQQPQQPSLGLPLRPLPTLPPPASVSSAHLFPQSLLQEFFSSSSSSSPLTSTSASVSSPSTSSASPTSNNPFHILQPHHPQPPSIFHHHPHPAFTALHPAFHNPHFAAVAAAAAGAAAVGKRKKSWTRAVFSNLQRKGLEKRFQIQKYITKPDRRQLAASLGLTDAQVKVWFQNRRMKWRHQEQKERREQERANNNSSSKKDQQQQQQQQQQHHSTPSPRAAAAGTTNCNQTDSIIKAESNSQSNSALSHHPRFIQIGEPPSAGIPFSFFRPPSQAGGIPFPHPLPGAISPVISSASSSTEADSEVGDINLEDDDDDEGNDVEAIKVD